MLTPSRTRSRIGRLARPRHAAANLARCAAELAALALFVAAIGASAVAIGDRAPPPLMLSEARR